MKLHLPLLPSSRPKLPHLSPPIRSSSLSRFTASMSSTPRHICHDKLVVIMGATGAGKSRLSIDLATRFPFEIINSDKIQVYRGLDITTNKIPLSDRSGVPHHLLGEFDRDITPSQYRQHAAAAVSEIISRRHHPLLVGGSNSLVCTLLSDRYDPNDSDPLDSAEKTQLRYRCCFLWVDVSLPVLNEYLVKRVDDMFDSGMLDELANFYSSGIGSWRPDSGLRKAIGVPEFGRYFRMFPPDDTTPLEGSDQVRKVVYEESLRAIKDNTCRLAKRQMEKIVRLKNAGWDLQRLDATDAFRQSLEGSATWQGLWERQIVDPSSKIVQRFLEVE